MADRARTNNMCEGWNNMLQHAIGHSHPTIPTLVQLLQEDSVHVSTQMQAIDRGLLDGRVVVRQVERRQRLVDLCLDLETGEIDIGQFLEDLTNVND